MNLSILKLKISQLPQTPGVYFFKDEKKQILYIGKATNLRSRVQSYFRTDSNQRMNANLRISSERGPWIERMVSQVSDIDFQETDSVLEALILESNLIKKHLPKYNTLEKDDKSFAYFVITKEEFPRVLIIRYTDLLKIKNLKLKISNKLKAVDILKEKNFKYNDVVIDKFYGPYTSKNQMQIALKIVRRIFPFHAHKQKTEKGCLDFQLGVCPGPYANAITKDEYKKNIKGIRMILEGKKKGLIGSLEREMKEAAKKHEFEKAVRLRDKIFALQHIRDIALMTRDFDQSRNLERGAWSENASENATSYALRALRIEAYDISNISGDHAVGSMVVFENNHPNKSQYRKFKIKTIVGSDDVGMMREVLLRRFRNDWPMPDLVLLDGGQGHANMMSELVRELGLDVLVVAVAKGKERKNLNFQFPISNKISMLQFPKEIQNILNNKLLIKRVMDEAHRFAISYHRNLRGKNSLK